MAYTKHKFVLAPMGSGKTRFIERLKEIGHPLSGKFLDGDEILASSGVKNRNIYWYPGLHPDKDFSENRRQITEKLVEKFLEGYNVLYSPNPQLFYENLKEIYYLKSNLPSLTIYVVKECDALTRWGNLRVRGERGGYCPSREYFDYEEKAYEVEGYYYSQGLPISIIKRSKFLDLVPLRIAIAGKARAGKDTVGEYLCQNKKFRIFKFASVLYDIMNYAQCRCRFEKSKDRKFLQYIGTEWAREKDPNVWIDLTLKQINLPANHFNNVIITDLRFENEFKALRNDGFWLVRIKRDEAESDETFGNGDRSHSSETGLDAVDDEMFDYVIKNNDTLEELYKKIDDMLDFLAV